MAASAGTNDSTGFYFSQINTWFCNMSIVIILATNIKSIREIIKCLVASMAVLVIPIIVIVATHPSYLGLREDTFGNVSFGGGLWNIGTIGFGSITWLSLALLKYATKRQKRFIIFSTILFAFVGIAGLSRTIVLMIAMSLLFYFLRAKKDIHWAWKLIAIFVTFALVFFLQSNLFTTLLSRFGDSTSGTHNIRFKLWEAYLSHYKEYWLIGAPLGSVYNYYRDVNLFGRYFLPHSTPLNFFVRYGVFALLAYIYMIRNSFLSILKHEEDRTVQTCILSGCIAYISLAFINQTGFAESIFYVMFGLLIAYSRVNVKENKHRSSNVIT